MLTTGEAAGEQGVDHVPVVVERRLVPLVVLRFDAAPLEAEAERVKPQQLGVVEVALVHARGPDVIGDAGRLEVGGWPGLARVKGDAEVDEGIPIEKVVVVAGKTRVRAVDSALDLVRGCRRPPEEGLPLWDRGGRLCDGLNKQDRDDV